MWGNLRSPPWVAQKSRKSVHGEGYREGRPISHAFKTPEGSADIIMVMVVSIIFRYLTFQKMAQTKEAPYEGILSWFVGRTQIAQYLHGILSHHNDVCVIHMNLVTEHIGNLQY